MLNYLLNWLNCMKNFINRIKNKYVVAIFLLIALCLICFRAWQLGIFHDLTTLRAYVDRLGYAAPLLLIFLHLLQILVPFIPGGVVLTAVVVACGPLNGFIVNFIGIISGSIISFALARHFGNDFVRKHIKADIWQKYFRWLDNEKLFRRMFLLLILLPFAPDDALCMLAGVAKISTHDFLIRLIFGKIPVLLLYSLGMMGADALL